GVDSSLVLPLLLEQAECSARARPGSAPTGATGFPQACVDNTPQCSAFWAMKSPQGATAACARWTASFGARCSVARPCRSSVSLPSTLLSALRSTPRACSPAIEAVVSQAAGGQGPPHPPSVAALRGRSSGLLLWAVCRTTG